MYNPMRKLSNDPAEQHVDFSKVYTSKTIPDDALISSKFLINDPALQTVIFKENCNTKSENIVDLYRQSQDQNSYELSEGLKRNIKPNCKFKIIIRIKGVKKNESVSKRKYICSRKKKAKRAARRNKIWHNTSRIGRYQ